MAQENFQVAAIQETTSIGAAQEKLRIAGEYLAAVNARNLQAVGKTLHPEFHFVGPAGEAHNREGFLETFHRVFANVEKLDMAALASAENLVYYTYYAVMPPPLGPVHGTMKTTHAENGLIKKIEMAHSSATLENNPSPKNNPRGQVPLFPRDGSPSQEKPNR